MVKGNNGRIGDKKGGGAGSCRGYCRFVRTFGVFFRYVDWRGFVPNRSDIALHYCSGRILDIVSLYASCVSGVRRYGD